MRGSEVMRQRWDDCTVIASHLGITKREVNHYLYAEIEKEGWTQQARNNDPETISKIRLLPGYLNCATPRDRELMAEYHSSQDETEAQTKLRPAATIILATRFIEAIGDADAAVRAVQAAATAIHNLRDKS